MSSKDSVELIMASGKITMELAAEKLATMGFKVYMPENEFSIYFSDRRENSVAKISPILSSSRGEVSIFTQCKDTAMFESNKIIKEKIQTKDISSEILTQALKESRATGSNRAFLSTKEWLEPYLKSDLCPNVKIVEPNTSFTYLPYDDQELEGLSKDEILKKIDAPKELYEKVLTMTRGKTKRVMYFHAKEDLEKAIDAGLSEDEKEEMYQNATEGGVIDIQEKFVGKLMKELPLDPIHSDEKMTGGYFLDLIESSETILINRKSTEAILPPLPEIEELNEEPMFYRLN